MSIWRSAGWPCNDAIELDVLAAGWARVEASSTGHPILRLSDLGIRLLAESRQRNRRSLSAHDRLADRVSTHLMSAGRIVWRELSLRTLVAAAGGGAPSASPDRVDVGLWPDPDADSTTVDRRDVQAKSAWRMARPDLFSVRHTSVEAYLHPMVHEVKISRADLLSDLRHDAKRASYQWLSCETYFVFPAGIAEVDEIPQPYGVWILEGAIDGGTLSLARPARHVPCQLPFAVWMALAKATPVNPLDGELAQRELGDPLNEMGPQP